MMRVVRAGSLYFVLVFAAGFVLGPIRIGFVTPHFGATAAVLIEAPFMLAVMILAARWVTRVAALPLWPQRLGMGFVALGFLLIAETLGALAIRGLAFREFLTNLGRPPGLVFLAMALIFAAMPMLVGRRAGEASSL